MFIRRRIVERPEYVFLYLAAFFGLLMAVLIPPFQTPDEYTHFYRAYEVSELKTPKLNDSNKRGSYLPASILLTQQATRGFYGEIRSNPNGKYELKYTKESLKIPLNQDKKIFYETSAGESYNPIPYLPQAIAIATGKFFNSPIITMIYLVRVINLAVWIALLFCAIKIIPWKKWGLVGIALLPTVIAQSVSPGVDVLLLGSSFIFTALIFRAVSNKKIGRSDLSILLVLGSLMTFSKVVSVVLLPLIFIVSRKYFRVKHATTSMAAVVLLPILVNYVCTLLLSEKVIVDTESVADVQLSGLLTQPLNFLFEITNTFLFGYGDAVIRSLIGYFGWFDAPLALPFVVIGYFILFIAIFINDSERIARLTTKQNTIILCICASYFIAVCLAMYIFSTNPDLNYVTGIQGRYFVPIFMPIMILFSGINIFYAKRKYSLILVLLSVILLLGSVVTIFSRYYTFS